MHHRPSDARGARGSGPRRCRSQHCTARTVQTVRAWAQAQGLQVRAKGRMPAKVIAAYREAHRD